MTMLDTALVRLRAGLCVLPAIVKEKRPDVGKWKLYQRRRPTEEEVCSWFADAEGMCIVAGATSGGVEMIDFDLRGERFGPWAELVNAEAPGLLERLVIERSQSGGKHVVYRLRTPVPGSDKLAQRIIVTPDGEAVTICGKTYRPRRVGDRFEVTLTLIETRGEGGLFLCAPTPGYDLLQGDFLNVPVLTAEERDILIESAQVLNEAAAPPEPPAPTASVAGADGSRPGDDFNRRGDMRAVLLRHGWTLVRPGENEYWRRPGKTAGWSATLKDRVFYVFSTSADPFAAEKAYSPFRVYALLEHGGDFAKAASALRAEGYGGPDAAPGDVDASGIAGELQSTGGATSSPHPDEPVAAPAAETPAAQAGSTPPSPAGSEPVVLTDEQIIRIASDPRRKNDAGRKFAALYAGQWNSYFNSPKDADSSICWTLAYYSKDPEQIDRLFRGSKMMRPQWEQPHGDGTYGQAIIRTALSNVTGQYRPRPRRHAPAPSPAVEPPNDTGLPEVILPGGPATISEAADKLGRLLAETGQYYVRGGGLVALDRDKDGVLILRPIKPAALASVFESVARLTEFTKENKEFVIVPAICREQDAKLILYAAPFQAMLPPIHILTRCPVLIEREGNLVQVSGYDRASGIFAAGGRAPDVPLDEAVAMLHDMMTDFRFATPADKARALAAVITPSLVFGGLLRGRAPVDLGEADQSQSGKGYRNKTTAAVYNCAVKTITQKKGGVGSLEETLNSALVAGHNLISIDNVRGTIDSPAIESFLTEDTYEARIPHMASVEIDPRRTMLMLTSNKASITPDLANRSSCVRILKQAPGHQFKGYSEGDILQHVAANQPRYLGAVFAVVRAWFEAGRPRTRETRHDFRPWAQTLDWIVQNVLRAGPLLDGHRETQVRMATPVLNWLRDVALAVRRAGQLGVWLRASTLVDLLADTPSVETPGLPEGGDVTDEVIRKKVLQAMGRKLSLCFGGESAVAIDDMRIARQETADALARPVKEYRFTVAEHAPDRLPYAPDAHRGRIGEPIAETDARASDDAAPEMPGISFPHASSMRSPMESAKESPRSPMSAMGSGVGCNATVYGNVRGEIPPIEKYSGTHRGIGENAEDASANIDESSDDWIEV